MSVRKVSRRVFLTSTAAGVGGGAASLIASRGSPAHAEEEPPRILDIVPSDEPFFHSSLRARAASLAEQYGRPDVAAVIKTDCYDKIFTAVRTAPQDTRALTRATYLDLFPNGPQLASVLSSFATIDWSSPRQDVDLGTLSAQHLSARAITAAPLRYVSVSPAPDTDALTSFLNELRSRWNEAGIRGLAKAHGRRGAAMAAGSMLQGALNFAFKPASSYVPEPLLDSLRKSFWRIARFAGWHAVVADLVDFGDPSAPFLAMLPGGVIPIGITSEGVFDVIGVGQ